MSHNNVTTWTCDRCGRSAVVEHKDTPIGWWYVSAAPVSQQLDVRSWEVCNGCYSQAERLLMNQKDVAAA